MDIDVLTKLGMTKTEAKVYIEILKLKESTIGPIIKKTSLHRGTVYNSINSLIRKSFVSFIDKQGIRYYKSSGEKIFDNILDEKQDNIKQEKKKIEEIFSSINKIKDISGVQEVDVFYGVEAFKTLFLEIYDECKKHDCEYLFQGRGGEMQDATGQEFYKYTQKLKKKLKIRCRVILDTENIKHSYHKYVVGDIRHLPSAIYSPINIWIYQDIVLLIMFRAYPLTSIKIKSKELADGFRNYFESLWKIARK